MSITWPYKVIDDFFTEDIYAELSKWNGTECDPKLVIRHEHIVKGGQVIRADVLDEKFVAKVHKLYHPRMMQWLEEMIPEKVKQVYTSHLCITIFGMDLKKRIHKDFPSKLLTVLTYMHPEQDNGTVLYNNRFMDGEYQVKWKQNRALVYPNVEDSWHSYKCKGEQPRYTVHYSLQSNADNTRARRPTIGSLIPKS